MDGARDGQSRGYCGVIGGEDLARPRSRAPSLAQLDKAFAEKLHDVVGLYVSPPAHAILLSVHEKSQIQALGRTQPALPLKRACGATMTHSYQRNGTTTLFAALNVLDSSVIVNGTVIFPGTGTDKVKFPTLRFEVQEPGIGTPPSFGGRPRRRASVGAGGVIRAVERTCSGSRSACRLRR